MLFDVKKFFANIPQCTTTSLKLVHQRHRIHLAFSESDLAWQHNAYRKNFAPIFILALFPLRSKDEFKTGLIYLYTRGYIAKLEIWQIQDWAHEFQISLGRIQDWTHEFQIYLGRIQDWPHEFQISLGRIQDWVHEFQISLGRIQDWAHEFQISLGRIQDWAHEFQISLRRK